MDEEWKDIIGYKGLYKISSRGRVLSLTKDLILSDKLNKSGYYAVQLFNKGKMCSWLVHRLVAIHFLPNSDGKPEINHINLTKTDNRVENLEWCTRLENVTHFMMKGNADNSFNRAHKGNQCASKGVIAFRDGKQVGTYESITKAAKELNISRYSISLVCRGKSEAAGGYTFRFCYP